MLNITKQEFQLISVGTLLLFMQKIGYNTKGVEQTLTEIDSNDCFWMPNNCRVATNFVGMQKGKEKLKGNMFPYISRMAGYNFVL